MGHLVPCQNCLQKSGVRPPAYTPPGLVFRSLQALDSYGETSGTFRRTNDAVSHGISSVAFFETSGFERGSAVFHAAEEKSTASTKRGGKQRKTFYRPGTFEMTAKTGERARDETFL